MQSCNVAGLRTAAQEVTRHDLLVSTKGADSSYHYLYSKHKVTPAPLVDLQQFSAMKKIREDRRGQEDHCSQFEKK